LRDQFVDIIKRNIAPENGVKPVRARGRSAR
jgi:hypothetical protein